MKVYLIGMPGSGKTTLGKQLAETLSLEFVDLDVELEKKAGKPVTEIFRDNGEDHFRLMESKLLSEWAASSKSFVMATGGGAPCFYQGIAVINKTGLSIFIDVPVNKILGRIESNEDRPLLSGNEEERKERLINLRNARLAIYQQATITLADPTLQDILKSLQL